MFKKIMQFLLGKKTNKPLEIKVGHINDEMPPTLEVSEELKEYIPKKETPKMSKPKKKKPKVKKEIDLTFEEETKIVTNLKKKGIYSEPTKKKKK
jgi:hypothetical protein